MNYFKNFSKLILIPLLVCSFNLTAQKSEGGFPKSFGMKPSEKSQDIISFTMPNVNARALLKEDSLTYASSKDAIIPLRIAKGFNVNYSIKNTGTWDSTSNGDRVWRLRIKSPQAHSIILYFSEFDIPDGAQLFIYNKDSTQIMGAFTSNNNNEHHSMSISPVKGEEIIVEYFEPKDIKYKGSLTIGNIGHDYLGVGSQDGNFGGSLSCEVNSICPQWSAWQTEKTSVGRIIFLAAGTWWLCTGSLINNVRQDGTPYFLTANHCICSQAIASTVIIAFNYESPTCISVDGSIAQTISGSTLKANWAGSDFSLLQLSSTPPTICNTYFLGWDKSGFVPASPVTAIHHPRGDVKKISQSYGTLTSSSTNYYKATDFCDQNVSKATWTLARFDVGTVEPGSSGSPLLDNNKRIVGQLYGGNGICNGLATYGRFSSSWTGNNTPTTQLKYWLDPDNSGVSTLNGNFFNSISGPYLLFCSPTAYTILNKHPSDTIFWDCSTNISKISTAYSNPFYFQANGYGPGSISASIKTSCGTSVLPVLNVWVGKFESTPVTGQSGVCPNSIYNYTAQVPGGYSSSYSFSWTYPSNWMQNNQYQNTITLQTPMNNPSYGAVRVSITNPCGASGYSGLTVYPGTCPHYFTIYPNPASNDITITMIDNSTYSTATDTIITNVNSNISTSDVPINFTIRIYNSQSALISSVQRSGSSFSVPLTNMRDGTYIIEVSDGKTSYTQPLIVKHN